MTCGIGGCQRTFTKFSQTFQVHISALHRHQADISNIHALDASSVGGVELDDGCQEIVIRDTGSVILPSLLKEEMPTIEDEVGSE